MIFQSSPGALSLRVPRSSTAASGWTDDEHVPIVSPFPMQWASFVA